MSSTTNPRAPSLRLRLLLVILVPLMLIALIAGVWRYQTARITAVEVFDRNLTALTLVVAGDVLRSGGDALSAQTRDILESAGGGAVFYHAAGPDRSLLTGYAYPPRPPTPTPSDGLPRVFSGTHKGEEIRAAQMVERANFDGISGPAIVTVWQSTANRDAFARTQGLNAMTLLASVILAAMAIVWFGVRVGLRPLEDLQEAISRRRPDDLTPIMRAVPDETRAIVGTLNALFGQVRNSMEAREQFISDAAHQLRNPIAGIRALADSVGTAPDKDTAQARAAKVAQAAAKASELTDQLLRFERLRAKPQENFERLDLNELVRNVALDAASRAMDSGVEFSLSVPQSPIFVRGDPLLLKEAIQNLLDNALKHGGAALTAIDVSITSTKSEARITIEDNGAGVAPPDRARIFERFAQSEGSVGTGLGLAIVAEIAKQHQGRVECSSPSAGNGARFSLCLPLLDWV